MDYVERDLDLIPRSERRENSVLMLDILEAVPIDALGNIDNIAKAAGARWDTTRKYIELIILIQNSPKVRVFDVAGSPRTMYRRDPGGVRREL